MNNDLKTSNICQNNPLSVWS